MGDRRGFDDVQRAQHYNVHPSGVEAIVLLEDLSFNVGTALKYLVRAGIKEGEAPLKDYKKAEWYIKREISRLSLPVNTEHVRRQLDKFILAEPDGAVGSVFTQVVPLGAAGRPKVPLARLKYALAQIQAKIRIFEHPEMQ